MRQTQRTFGLVSVTVLTLGCLSLTAHQSEHTTHAELNSNRLTVSMSRGSRGSDFSVTFESLNNGADLRVTEVTLTAVTPDRGPS